MSLFQRKQFTMHSGGIAQYKIECDALTDEDIDTLAWMIAQKGKFSAVRGVPAGGLRLEKALRPFTSTEGPRLIVDDVLTTGDSMEEYKLLLGWPDALGVVIFARGRCPMWVHPIFQMHWFNTQDDHESTNK